MYHRMSAGSLDEVTSANLSVWGIGPGQSIVNIPGFEGRSYGAGRAIFSPDSRLLAFATPEWEIKLWDIANQRFLRTLGPHPWIVYNIRFSPDGRYVASELGRRHPNLRRRHRQGSNASILWRRVGRWFTQLFGKWRYAGERERRLYGALLECGHRARNAPVRTPQQSSFTTHSCPPPTNCSCIRMSPITSECA